MSRDSKLFCALLKYWRGRRGLSQLDLAVVAEVSPRHLSFLETGRANPGEEMVLRLAAALDVPLRDRNALLREAGFGPRFPEPELDALDDPAIERAIERMLRQQEPYPMLLLSRSYEILRINGAVQRLFGAVVEGELVGRNALVTLFDPAELRPYVIDWEETAQELVTRLQRETLLSPHDHALAELLDQLLAYPGVPKAWQRPDFTRGSAPAVRLRVRMGEQELGFLTTITRFNAPQNVTLDELQIESYFPLDELTEQVCAAMAAGG